MKKKILQLVFVSTCLLSVIFGKAIGQTSVHINYAFDSTFQFCPVPISTNFNVYGVAHGYPVGDSVNVHIYFGDGNDTTFWYLLVQDSLFYPWCYHTFYSAGQFSVKYVVTAPDGRADSVVNVNELALGDTCGNISGRVYMDYNSNCTYDAGDSLIWGALVGLYSGTSLVQWSMTDSLGYYYFSVPTGYPYTIKVDTSYWYWSMNVTCPSNRQYNVATAPSSGNDFGGQCLPGFDLSGYFWGHRFHPGLDAWGWMWAYNRSCNPVSGQAKLVIDLSKISFVSSTPAPTSIVGDTLIWDFNSINISYPYWWWWYGNASWSNITFNTNANAVIGDSVCFTLIVDPINGDNNPANNIVNICYPISLSWDPNFKIVSPKGLGPQGFIAPTQQLTYNIHFQNTGHDTAHYVAVYDTLNANLDVSTFQVLSSDHRMTTEIIGTNIVKFSFANIMLPDSAHNPTASQGQLTYTIKPKAGLPNGTVITNTAGIVFDYNLPVRTNQTINTIETALDVPVINPVNASLVSIFPNPAANELNIKFNDQKASDVSLVDAIGNVVVAYQQVKGNLAINTSKIPAGIYSLVVNNKDAMQREKVIIIH